MGANQEHGSGKCSDKCSYLLFPATIDSGSSHTHDPGNLAIAVARGREVRPAQCHATGGRLLPCCARQKLSSPFFYEGWAGAAPGSSLNFDGSLETIQMHNCG